jgi:CRAL/TRIO domain
MFAHSAAHHVHHDHGQFHQQQRHQLSLTEPELEWAWEIKEAVDLDPDLRSISDFEIAQLAIVTLGLEDLYSIRERVLVMQALRDEYKIVDTPEEGVALMRGLTCLQQPGYILAFDVSPNGRNYTVVIDMAAKRPSATKSDEDFRVYLGGFYYMLTAACSNLTAIREGVVHICECDGMSYANFSHSVMQRFLEELAMHYPIETKESLWVHTPMVANIMASFVKPWLNSRKGRWERIKLGCKLDSYDGRLDALLNVPTPQAAQEKLLHNLYLALSERFHNQKIFELPPNPMEVGQSEIDLMEQDD